MAKETLFWFHREVGVAEWEVSLAMPSLMRLYPSRGEDKDGVCIYADRKILINAAAPRDVQDRTVLHEIGHVLCEALPLSRDHEEQAVESVTAGLWKMLGPFRWPSRPKGAAAFERAAREERAT